MSKGFSYQFMGTRGHISGVINSLPNNHAILLKNGWVDISHPKAKKAGHWKLREEKTGLIVEFDKGIRGQSGYKGMSHYHVLNPNATSTKDMYLDTNGNPVSKNSPASHILSNGGTIK